MLDAYIIERIRREHDVEDSGREQLRIDIPGYDIPADDTPSYERPPRDGRPDRGGWSNGDWSDEDDTDPQTDRGIAIIDFTI